MNSSIIFFRLKIQVLGFIMKEYQAYPVFKTIPDSYHLESPVVDDNRLLWVEIHHSPEAGSPGTVNYLDIPKEGAWTLLFFWPKRRNWGFWDREGHMIRPLEYCHRHGIMQDENYQ